MPQYVQSNHGAITLLTFRAVVFCDRLADMQHGLRWRVFCHRIGFQNPCRTGPIIHNIQIQCRKQRIHNGMRPPRKLFLYRVRRPKEHAVITLFQKEGNKCNACPMRQRPPLLHQDRIVVSQIRVDQKMSPPDLRCRSDQMLVQNMESNLVMDRNIKSPHTDELIEFPDDGEAIWIRRQAAGDREIGVNPSREKCRRFFSARRIRSRIGRALDLHLRQMLVPPSPNSGGSLQILDQK